MKLDDFANNYFDFSKQSSDIWSDNKFDNVNNAFGGAAKATPALITSTWQTLLESPDLSKKLYPKALENISNYPHLESNLEKYLICQGDDKYYLLVFDPAMTTEEPKVIDASHNNSIKSINTGYGIWRSKMNNAINMKRANDSYFGGHSRGVEASYNKLNEFSLPEASFYNEGNLGTINSQIVGFSVKNTSWPMIIMKPPKRILTSYYAKSPHKVYYNEKDPPNSLAGIYTRNVNGDFGATVCLHGFPGSYAAIGKSKVKINDITGTVISAHNISDSCFVKIEGNEGTIPGLLTCNGPLQGTTPRQFEDCLFMNKEGEQTETNVIGWSPDILYYDPYNQVKVLTKPITNPGDSGSALLDKTNNVLGFSFYRTEINAVLEFSAWIWAASVFKAHNLIN